MNGGDGDGDEPYAARLSQLRATLAVLVEGIDELAFDVLQDAAASGLAARPELDRRLTRARNGLERVARHLEPPDEGGGELA